MLAFLGVVIAPTLPFYSHSRPQPVVTQERKFQYGLDQAAQTRVQKSYGRLPLSFEANRGQTDARVDFLSRGSGYTLFLTPAEAMLVLPVRQYARTQTGSPVGLETVLKIRRSAVLRMKIENASRSPRVAGLEELPAKSNYLIGNDPKKWQTGISHYAKVLYEDVYPGVSLIYYGNQRQLEYDFVVAPGADPRIIKLVFEGYKDLRIDYQGDLVMKTAAGVVRQHEPFIYQVVDGVRKEISGRYVKKGAGRVGFDIGPYDKSKPLIIDPVLSYSTYLGGSNGGAQWTPIVFNGGQVTPIAIDPTNPSTIYAGTGVILKSTDGGASFTVTDRSLAGTVSSIVIDPTNPSTVYAGLAFFGGVFKTTDGGGRWSNINNGLAHINVNALALDPANPATLYAGASTFEDAFVSKISPSGSALVYSTYLGGAFHDLGIDIATDPEGNAYVIGDTNSFDYPRVNAFQPTNSTGLDVFVSKLNPTGSALLYSTYLGGTGTDVGTRIAVDSLGHAHLTGVTNSPNFPLIDALQQTAGGLSDVFVARLDAGGKALGYSTYLGGEGDDQGLGVAVDSTGDTYVTGLTRSGGFPITPGAYQAANNGMGDAFIAKIITPCASLSLTRQAFVPDGGTGSVGVTAVEGCSWPVKSNADWVTVTSSGAGSGVGTVAYSAAENLSSNPRSATIIIGDQTFRVLQGARFNDVPDPHPFRAEIGKLSALSITLGCDNGIFCPDQAVTREQMAAFIIRTTGLLNPPKPLFPRFFDVPPDNFFYAYIDQLAARQITVGCGNGNYCPTVVVTREQMAAFIIRTFGEFNPPAPAMQRFLDVPPSNPFYSFIDRMAALGITLGCGGGNYCPSEPVTRGQMAAFLVRAFNL